MGHVTGLGQNAVVLVQHGGHLQVCRNLPHSALFLLEFVMVIKDFFFFLLWKSKTLFFSGSLIVSVSAQTR